MTSAVVTNGPAAPSSRSRQEAWSASSRSAVATSGPPAAGLAPGEASAPACALCEPSGRSRRGIPPPGLGAPVRTLPRRSLPAVSRPAAFPLAFPFSFRFASRGRLPGVVLSGGRVTARDAGTPARLPAGKTGKSLSERSSSLEWSRRRARDPVGLLVTGDRWRLGTGDRDVRAAVTAVPRASGTTQDAALVGGAETRSPR